MPIEFDPNNQKSPKAPVWASYVPRRSPQFKTHTQLNHATSACSQKWPNYGGGIVYKFVEGQWQEYLRIEEPTECSYCHEYKTLNDVKDTAPEGHRLWDYRKWHDIYWHKDGRKFYERPVVCSGCNAKHFGYNAWEPLKAKEVFGNGLV